MKKVFFAIAILCFTFSTILAQTNTGRLLGTISGPDGVLPGATVVVTDDRTGLEKTVTTGDAGTFTVPQLDVGTYTVKISATGFATQTQTNVVINVGQEYTLDVSLAIGAVGAEVTVVAGEDLVNTSSPELSRTVTERQITELPLNGRNPLALTQLQAGTASNPSQNTVINGFRTSTANIVQDGINVQDNFIRSNATDFSPGRATVDNVEQFTISTQAGADRGFGGPQIELVTPRGGNSFRGAAFIYNRNSRFAANNFFNNASGNFSTFSPDVIRGFRQAGEEVAPRPFLNRNQFGGRVGGPILKDKLFFFGYYEALRLRQDIPSTFTVLTESARNGLFTYTDNAGVLRQVNVFSLPIVVPSSNPGTSVPTAINSAVTSQILSRLPSGNSTLVGDGLNTTGFRTNRKSPTDRDQFTTRMDYIINEQNSINGVLDYSREDNARTDADVSFNQLPTVVQPARNTRVALAYRSSILSNLTNEVRGGIFFSKPEFLRTEDNPAAFIIPTLVSTPFNTFQEQGRRVRTFNLNDTADYVIGNHSLRFGGQYQRVSILAFNDAGIVPTFNIGTSTNTPAITSTLSAFPGGISTAQRNTANALFALLGGIVGSGAQTFNSNEGGTAFEAGATNVRDFKYSAIAGFINDNFRVTQGLTLNLGLRYDYYTPLKSDLNLFLEPVIPNLDDPVSAILNPNGFYQRLGTNIGEPGQFYQPDRNNFSPVLGIAYSPNFGDSGFGRMLFGEQGQTVFRAGFRFSYVNDELVRAPDNAAGGNAGFASGNSALFTPPGGTASGSLDSRLGGSLPVIGTPAFNVDSRTFALNNSPAFSRFGTVFAVDPNLETPRVSEYSVSFQRELPANFGFEIRYVGSKSDNLLRGIDFNQVNIVSNGFLADFNRARSNFLLTGNAACTPAQNAGCQTLTVFPNLASGGLLTNGTILGNIQNGTPADLAIVYIQNGLTGTVNFLPNPNTGVADLLTNSASTKYDSLQAEIRRRFANGFDFQANYTFSKTLTDAQGTAQTRFEPLLDNARPELEESRADFDQSHVFNLNANYELPFGKGKQFFNEGGLTDRLLGGFQLTSIIRYGSGAPITFTDARGTFNRAGRSGRQTALTNLTKEELKNLVGVFRTQNGIFFINPTALGRDPQTGLPLTGRSGRGADGFGTTPFSGQVFFNNAPGQTSGLERAVVNAPNFFNMDASIIKNIPLTERMRIQLRGEFFNIFNTVNFVPGQFLDINGANFGRVQTATAPRISQFALRFEF